MNFTNVDNSYAFRSHSIEVGTAIHIGCSTFQMALSDSHTLPFIVFFPTRKEYPKNANDSPVARYLTQVFLFRLQTPRNVRTKWHNLRSNYVGKKKVKRKNMRKWGYVERKMAILWCHQLFGVLLGAQNYDWKFPETATATATKFHSPIQMKLEWAILNNWKKKI